MKAYCGKAVISLDLGSTFFKAAVFSSHGALLGKGSHRLRYLHRDVRVEFSVEEAREGARNAMRKAISSSAIDVGTIGGIGITSQAQTFTICNVAGEYLMPFFSWEDMRSVCEHGMMDIEPLFSDFPLHCSFKRLSPRLQICQLKRLHSEGIIRKDCRITPLPSYMIRLMTGRNVTDNNVAAMTGLFSLKTGGWHRGYLEYCGLAATNMPELAEVGKAVGSTAKSAKYFGLPEGIPVFSCGNDQTAGAFGVGLEEGMPLITLGSAQVAYLRTSKMPKPLEGTARGHYPGGSFYRMATSSFGGNLISRIVGKKNGIGSYQEFFRLAGRDGSKHNTFLKIGEDSGKVSWDRLMGKDELAYSALAYLCRNMGKLLDILIPTKTRHPGKMLVTGGGSRKSKWIEMLSNELGVGLIVVDADPLFGTAKMVLQEVKQS